MKIFNDKTEEKDFIHMAALFFAANSTADSAEVIVDKAVQLRDELKKRSKENKLGL